MHNHSPNADHTQSVAPFTIGCYGPVTSLNACKSLYSTCNTGYVTYNATVNGKTGVYTNYDTVSEPVRIDDKVWMLAVPIPTNEPF